MSDEFITEIESCVSKLTDEQLEKVAGGNRSSILQICVTCNICQWDTGWINVNGSSDIIRTLMAMHNKTTRHDDFKKEYK